MALAFLRTLDWPKRNADWMKTKIKMKFFIKNQKHLNDRQLKINKIRLLF